MKHRMKDHSFILFFLTSQDWQICKENLIPYRDLLYEKLFYAGVHLNLPIEICAGRLFLRISDLIITTTNLTIPMPIIIADPTMNTHITIANLMTPTSTPITSILTNSITSISMLILTSSLLTFAITLTISAFLSPIIYILTLTTPTFLSKKGQSVDLATSSTLWLNVTLIVEDNDKDNDSIKVLLRAKSIKKQLDR